MTDLVIRNVSADTGWELPKKISKELCVLVNPSSKYSRSIQSTVSQVQHMYVDNGIRSFCFISDAGRAGTSVIAANAAAAFAASGLRTVLVDTNFSQPRQAELFGLDKRKPGLSEWVSGIGDVNVWSGYMQPAFQNLIVIPAGAETHNAEALLATELRHFVLELSRMFDVVLCDAAPISNLAGTLAVVSAVERTIIVARADKTRLKELVSFQEIVKQCDGQIGGMVYVDY